MTAHGARRLMIAPGLLHVLGAHLSAGGGAGSRAGEAKKSGRGVQGPAARWGLLRRALDADPPPATLGPRREGARPLGGIAG